MNEVVALLDKRGAKVTIRIDLEAEYPDGYDSKARRDVKENARTLKFDHADFL